MTAIDIRQQTPQAGSALDIFAPSVIRFLIDAAQVQSEHFSQFGKSRFFGLVKTILFFFNQSLYTVSRKSGKKILLVMFLIAREARVLRKLHRILAILR